MIALTCVVMPTLLRLRRLLHEIEKLIESARLNLAPLIHDVTQITWSVQKLIGNIEHIVQSVDDSFEAVRNTTDELRDFGRRISHLIERRFAIISAFFRGVGEGLSKYWRSE